MNDRDEFEKWFPIGKELLEYPYSGDAPTGFEAGWQAAKAHYAPKIKELEESKNDAYSERNHLVAALAHIYPSGIGRTNIPGWLPDWHNCVYIDLPSGQISYHYQDTEHCLFADLPLYEKEWDCHDKDMVHKRLMRLKSII